MPCHIQVEGFTYLTTRRASSYHCKLAILSYQSIGCVHCQTYPYAVQQLHLSPNSWRRYGTGLYCLFYLHYTKISSTIFHTSHAVWLTLRCILVLVQSSRRSPRRFRNGISWVKTTFPQTRSDSYLKQSDVLKSWQLSWYSLKMAPTHVGVLIKQCELVYERKCIKCWFNEDKINMNIMHGRYNIKMFFVIFIKISWDTCKVKEMQEKISNSNKNQGPFYEQTQWAFKSTHKWWKWRR